MFRKFESGPMPHVPGFRHVHNSARCGNDVNRTHFITYFKIITFKTASLYVKAIKIKYIQAMMTFVSYINKHK